MNKRHRWLLTATMVLLGGLAGFLWLTRDGAMLSGPDAEGLVPKSIDKPAVPAGMTETERQRLASEGVITNADRPLEVLARDPAVIMMRNAIIDTDIVRQSGETVDIPPEFRAPADFRQAIVVFEDPITAHHWKWVASQGLRVENFVPNRALVVSGQNADIVRLRDDPGVRHVEPFHPFFKMDRDIQAHLTAAGDRDSRIRATSGRYQVLLFGDAATAVSSAMNGIRNGERGLPSVDSPGVQPATGAFGIDGARIRELPALPGQAVVEVFSDPSTLKELVLAESVKWIEPAPRFESMGDLGRKTVGREKVRAVFPEYDGTGQIIGVVDTGADINHPALAGRLLPGGYLVKAGPTSDGLQGDAIGHGTHVLGTILGSGALSDTVVSAPGSGPGPYASHQFAGMATNAQYVMIEDFNSYTHPEMAWEAYSRGARIANNSWGSGTNFSYGIASMYWDALVKDVNWGHPAKQPYTVFFAAGNRGEGTTDGDGGTPGTISQPGNAKNVITIGAIEQKRRASNLPQEPYDSLNATDSDWNVASFSGRGPVGELDRRVKPDLVAPGEYVLSLQTASINSQFIDAPVGEIRDFNAGNVDTGSRYAFMSGTSRSTAFASGAGALLRQHYLNGGFGPVGVDPSPAMMKALLINGAQPLHNNAYEWGPKRDETPLTVATVTHEGTVTNQPGFGLIGWWRFSNHYRDELSGTNYFVDPQTIPGYASPPPAAAFSALNNNPGFGSYLRFQGGSVRFEMQEDKIDENWHVANRVRAIEFWVKRSDSGSAPLLAFQTDDTIGPRISFVAPNIVEATGTEMESADIYVNGTALVPVLKEGWNHVVVLPSLPITATNWILGNLTADIDEVRFYNSRLTPAQINHNYTNGVGYFIAAGAKLSAQLGGLHREDAVRDGWGRLDLAGSILGAETFDSNAIMVFDEDVPLTTDGDWQYLYTVPAGGAHGSLKVTLVWTDTHGTPGAGKMLVNDLDLRVRYRPGTADELTYVGNFLGRQTWGIASYPIRIQESGEFEPMAVLPGQYSVVEPLILRDRRQLDSLRDQHNNVEQVIIRDLLPGNYMIEVFGSQVPVEGDDGGQYFSLVINRGISSAGEPMGEEPVLTVDRDNTPVLAYTAKEREADLFAGTSYRTQIAVRRWIDSHTNREPRWRPLDNKWFHYGDGPNREIISRSEIGSANSPTLAFDTNNTLYVAWIQQNTALDTPDAVYLRYLTDERQRQTWNGSNRWQQLGISYQGMGISGDHFDESAISPSVGVVWDNQPMVAYRQAERVIAKKWSTNNMAWRGVDGSVTGLVSATAADAPVIMAIDFVGNPVLAWSDAGSGRIRVIRWSGSQWSPVAGGLVGDATASDFALDCDDFGGIALSWISSDGGTPSVRAARTTVGGASWRGLGYGAANSMQYPGICGATDSMISATRAAFTPRGNLIVSWLAQGEDERTLPLLRQWDGVQWGGISGSAQLPGLYDPIGSVWQPTLISDTNGYPLVALVGERTGQDEIRVMISQSDDEGGTDPDPSTPAPPPVLAGISVSGADGHYEYGETVAVSIQFDTNVTVVGTPILELMTAPVNRFAFYESGSGTDTLVFHYVVSFGDTQSGPALDYTGTDALRLNSGAFVVGNDWIFHASLPAPGTPESLSENSTITLDGAAAGLTVTSPWGTVSPPRGVTWFAEGSMVTAEVIDSPVTSAQTRYIATGWNGSGDVPGSGASTNLTFALDQDSTIDWQWQTNFWLTTVTNGQGTIEATVGGVPIAPNGWVTDQTEVTFTPTPATNHEFAYWQVNGVSNNADPLMLTITQPVSVTGYFVSIPTPAGGSDDPDEDSGSGKLPASDPEDPEDPTDPPEEPEAASDPPRLAISSSHDGSVALTWSAETGFVYEVEYRSLSEALDDWHALTNVLFTNTIMRIHDNRDSGPGGRFYRIRKAPAAQ